MDNAEIFASGFIAASDSDARAATDYGKLASEAIKARENSYSPYSGFMVGAALITRDGQVYHGCNVENAAYTPTGCAERTAFFKAVSEGAREFSAIAVAGWTRGGKPGFAYPCGVCRQVMAEFCDPESFEIIVAADGGNYRVHTLGELMPHSFGPGNLDADKQI